MPHHSIPAGIGALPALGGFAADATENPAALEAPLDGYAVVVFLSTSGEIRTPAGRARPAGCVEAGGGFAGVHVAACADPAFREHLRGGIRSAARLG
ncbi:ThuA domain-containing protein [Streptomyces sp. AD55]|uniref:ThuA domain-containing protein n=1 Tax=Streptomyces sp. AD55 TaxID=3242895 RepID=UPI00352747C8